jgi:hypothetical protein
MDMASSHVMNKQPRHTTIRCRVTARFVVTVVVAAVVGAGAATATTYAVEVRAFDGRFAFAVEVPGQAAALRLARRLGTAASPSAVLAALAGVR